MAAAKRQEAEKARELRLQGWSVKRIARELPVSQSSVSIWDKSAVVAHLVSTGAKPSVLDSEIAKCDVVCVNCHRRRTGRRAGWRKASPRWWETPAPTGPARARNLAVVHSILETYGCCDCGTRDLCVLEFDHVRGKTAPVFRLAHEPRSLQVVLDEIERCEIRCGNCHRRRHARAAETFRHRQAAS